MKRRTERFRIVDPTVDTEKEQLGQDTAVTFPNKKRREEIAVIKEKIESKNNFDIFAALKESKEDIQKNVEEMKATDAEMPHKRYDIVALLEIKEKWEELYEQWSLDKEESTSGSERLLSKIDLAFRGIVQLCEEAVGVIDHLFVEDVLSVRYAVDIKKNTIDQRKDAIAFQMEQYEKWKQLRKKLIASKKWDVNMEKRLYDMLGDIGINASFLEKESEGATGFHFILEHFEDSDIHHPERAALQKDCLKRTALNISSRPDINPDFPTDLDLESFRDRVVRFRESKDKGNLLGKARSVYELTRMIHLHINEVALEKSFDNPAILSKGDLIQRIIETVEGAGMIDISDGSPMSFAGMDDMASWRKKVITTKMKGDAKHILPRDIGGFNMRDKVLNGCNLGLWTILLRRMKELEVRDIDPSIRVVSKEDNIARMGNVLRDDLIDLVKVLPSLGGEALEDLKIYDDIQGDIADGNIIKNFVDICKKVIENSDVWEEK